MRFVRVSQLLVFLPILMIFSLLLLTTRVRSQALEDCQSKCGGVEIPYPFGIGNGCAKGKDGSFVVECLGHNTSDYTPYLLGDREIVKIDLEQGEITLINKLLTFCVKSDELVVDGESSWRNLSTTPFTFSIRNKLVVTGCATTAFLSNGDMGCSTLCSSLNQVHNNTCSGIGCCEASIDEPLKIFIDPTVRLFHDKIVDDKRITPCSRVFLVEDATFNFTTRFLTADEWSMDVHVVLDFAVDGCGEKSMKKESSTGDGHLCLCRKGYAGNPYTPDGCTTDIDECKQENSPCSKDCINTEGSYICTDKTRELTIILSVLGGAIFLFFFSWSSLWFYKKSKTVKEKKLRETNFRKNHSLLRQTLLSSLHEDVNVNTKFFTLVELEKATDKFDRARIIGEGGHGTVYKGLLFDQRIAAIKVSKVDTQNERKEFINEIILLSRFYHKNVVKLLGCCLESEMPLLVYEYIFNGTLYDHLHVKDGSYLGWDDRLRIATEVASAIVYLLSASSKVIFHRDLKSANILLDGKLTTKLSDFGASKSIDSDKKHVTATIQGTIGYLDPEYYQSGKLTEKSDVYSFGVILVELLTGKKPISREGNMITNFIKLVKENQVDLIFDPSIMEEIAQEELEVIARIAENCLNLRGEDRPTMKEIESTLESIRRSKKKNVTGKISREEQSSFLSDQMNMFRRSRTTEALQNSQEVFSISKSFNSAAVHLYNSGNARY